MSSAKNLCVKPDVILSILLLSVSFFVLARMGIGKLYLNVGYSKLVSGMATGSSEAVGQAERLFNLASHNIDLYQDAQRGIGVALFLQQELNGAISAWENVKPEDIYPLVLWLHSHCEFDIVTDLLEAALDKHPNSMHRLDWWHGLINSLFALEQWEMVIEAAQQALVEYPSDAELLLDLGRALYTRYQDVDSAERLIEQAIAEDEKFAEAYAWMGHMMSAEGRPDEAYDWYRKANEIKPSKNWRLLQANMARVTDLALAFTSYDIIIKDFPDYADAYYELAWAYLLANEIDMAIDAIEKALSYAPANGRYYYRAGEIIKQIEDPNQIIEVCQEIAEINPDNPLMSNKVCP